MATSGAKPARPPAAKRRPAARIKRRKVGRGPTAKSKKRALAAMRREAQKRARLLRLQRLKEQRQSKHFAKGAELFRAGQFGMARRYLNRAAAGPDASLAHRARIYLEICHQKQVAHKRVRLRTTEDFYNHAVRLVNDGDFEDAIQMLDKGISRDKGAAHLYYVKAVAKVLSGQRTGAIVSLRKAIKLDPDIRILAQHDPDMQSVIRHYPQLKLIGNTDT